MNARDLLQDFGVDPNLVVEFFVVFTRFEFALKETGYVSDAHGYAGPDWEAYAEEVAANFGPISPEEAAAIEGLTHRPPMRQRLRENRLRWVPSRLPRDIGGAIKAARQVRNNLFHGGKTTPHSSRDRDTALLQQSLDILGACLRRTPDVQGKFDEPQRP